MALIYHLCTPDEWEKALNTGWHVPPSWKTEGFIHCSARSQVLGSAYKHFPSQDRLVVLELNDKRLKEQLKWEASRGGSMFPHLYSKLALDWVETTHLLEKAPSGEWHWS